MVEIRLFCIWFHEKMYAKYIKCANQKKFNWFFALRIIAPLAPDDILCMIAGLTEMKILILADNFIRKTLTIAAYSLGLVYGAKWLVKLVGKQCLKVNELF